jgi:hypothetical protein
MTTFPADDYGRPIPVVAPIYGSSLEVAVTTTTGTAMNINTLAKSVLVRVMAIGCDIFYRAGTGTTVPTLVDGMVFAGTYADIPMTAAQTHLYCRARAGSGTARTELIG